MASLYDVHARELAGVGPEYHMASWEHKEATRKKPERLVVTLMTAPLLEDGEIAWAYADKAGKRIVDFALAEHDSWLLTWEQRTGKCHRCAHDHPGQEWLGWSKAEGDKYRTCPRCKGTNQAPHQARRSDYREALESIRDSFSQMSDNTHSNTAYAIATQALDPEGCAEMSKLPWPPDEQTLADLKAIDQSH